MDTAALLRNALDIGEALLKNGAEVYRVEDSIERVLKAYGAERVDVFTIPSLIIATLKMDNNEPITQTRRILRTGTNMSMMADLNALCRVVCKETPPPEEVAERLQAILNQRPCSELLTLFAYIIASFSFASFFGGTWGDAAASAVGGFFLYLIVRALQRLKVSPVFSHLGGAAVAATSALLMARLGLGTHLDKIVIGNIMLLIPGIELTNGMRDLFSGDILAGLLHIGEAVFIAALIALGAAYILSLGGAA